MYLPRVGAKRALITNKADTADGRVDTHVDSVSPFMNRSTRQVKFCNIYKIIISMRY